MWTTWLQGDGEDSLSLSDSARLEEGLRMSVNENNLLKGLTNSLIKG